MRLLRRREKGLLILCLVEQRIDNAPDQAKIINDCKVHSPKIAPEPRAVPGMWWRILQTVVYIFQPISVAVLGRLLMDLLGGYARALVYISQNGM
jgi:hypothetical protein